MTGPSGIRGRRSCSGSASCGCGTSGSAGRALPRKRRFAADGNITAANLERAEMHKGSVGHGVKIRIQRKRERIRMLEATAEDALPAKHVGRIAFCGRMQRSQVAMLARQCNALIGLLAAHVVPMTRLEVGGQIAERGLERARLGFPKPNGRRVVRVALHALTARERVAGIQAHSKVECAAFRARRRLGRDLEAVQVPQQSNVGVDGAKHVQQLAVPMVERDKRGHALSQAERAVRMDGGHGACEQ